ncbi:MAG: pitrilysin family protein [Acidobacteriota bacterium]
MRRPFRSGLVVALAAAGFGLAGAGTSAQVRGWPSERPPKPLPAREFTFPAYEIRTLANGLQVVVVQHGEQPAVSLRLLVRAGCAQDPPGKAGVANMVALLLDQGTTRRTAQEIADQIDTIGGGLSVRAGTDVTFATATVMKDSFDIALALVSELVRTPAFSPDELTRQLQQQRSALRVGHEDPDYLASVVFERLVYGLHPYGLPGNGTPESIERITRDDLVRFHELYFAPNNALLAVVGDVTPAGAFAAVERVFESWERREVPAPPNPEPPSPTRRVVVIDKPDAVQTEVRIGHRALPRAHQDHLQLEMAVRLLGGEGANRMQQVLRMQRGLTYGASANLQAYRITGDITAETDTRSQATGEVVRLMIDEFFKLQRETVRDRELDEVKAYMAGSYPLSIETPAGISTQVLNALFYGLPLQELQDYRDRVEAVRPEDIRRVTRAYLRPDRLSIVLVGNAGAFKQQLRGAGLRNVEIIPIGELDLTAVDLKRAEPRPAAPAPAPVAPAPSAPAGMPPERPTPAGQAPVPDDRLAAGRSRAMSILERAISAAGGLEVLRAVRTVRATALTTMHTPDGPLKTRTTTWVEYPSRVRVEAETSSGRVVQAYDAGHAWIQDAHGARDAPDGMRDAFGLSAQRDWIALLQAAAARRLSVRPVPDAKGVGGRALVGVELSGAGLPATIVYVDAASAQLERLVYEIPGPRGNETTTETFSDFRQVDFISVPFKAVVQRGGAPLLERTLTGIVFNDPIPEGLFAKPR